MTVDNQGGTDDLLDEFAQSYTGRPWDKDIELYQNRARWYDPVMGRFISTDPSGFDGGDANLYRYCNNNPATYNDPTGLCFTGAFNYNPLANVSLTNTSYTSSPLISAYDTGYSISPNTSVSFDNVLNTSSSYTTSLSDSYTASSSSIENIFSLTDYSTGLTANQIIRDLTRQQAMQTPELYQSVLDISNMYQTSLEFQEKSYAIMSGGTKEERQAAGEHFTGTNEVSDGSITYVYYKDLHQTGREPGLFEKAYWSIVSSIVPRTPPMIEKTYDDGSRILLMRNEPSTADAMSQLAVFGGFSTAAARGGAKGLAGAVTDEVIDTTFTSTTGIPVSPSVLRGGGRKAPYESHSPNLQSQIQKNLTRYDIVDGVADYTHQADAVAAGIKNGTIKVNLLGDELFERYARKLELENPVDTRAFARGRQIYLRRSSSAIMSDSVHEGTHVLDFRRGLDETRSIRQLEKRAYYFEHQFQKAGGGEIEFNTIEEIDRHIWNNY